MVGKQSRWLANHPRCRQPCHFPCSRFQTSGYFTMRGTTNPVIDHARTKNGTDLLNQDQERVQFRQYSNKVIPISSSECNSSFQELPGRQSSRSNQILTVTDMASLRGRSDKICITSGSIYLALDSHLLLRI